MKHSRHSMVALAAIASCAAVASSFARSIEMDSSYLTLGLTKDGLENGGGSGCINTEANHARHYTGDKFLDGAPLDVFGHPRFGCDLDQLSGKKAFSDDGDMIVGYGTGTSGAKKHRSGYEGQDPAPIAHFDSKKPKDVNPISVKADENPFALMPAYVEKQTAKGSGRVNPHAAGRHEKSLSTKQLLAGKHTVATHVDQAGHHQRA